MRSVWPYVFHKSFGKPWNFAQKPSRDMSFKPVIYGRLISAHNEMWCWRLERTGNQRLPNSSYTMVPLLNIIQYLLTSDFGEWLNMTGYEERSIITVSFLSSRHLRFQFRPFMFPIVIANFIGSGWDFSTQRPRSVSCWFVRMYESVDFVNYRGPTGNWTLPLVLRTSRDWDCLSLCGFVVSFCTMPTRENIILI